MIKKLIQENTRKTTSANGSLARMRLVRTFHTKLRMNWVGGAVVPAGGGVGSPPASVASGSGGDASAFNCSPYPLILHVVIRGTECMTRHEIFGLPCFCKVLLLEKH